MHHTPECAVRRSQAALCDQSAAPVSMRSTCILEQKNNMYGWGPWAKPGGAVRRSPSVEAGKASARKREILLEYGDRTRLRAEPLGDRTRLRAGWKAWGGADAGRTSRR